MKETVIKGRVWSGFVGEYKKPPIHIILSPGITAKMVFIDDILKKFITKDVEITVKVISHT